MLMDQFTSTNYTIPKKIRELQQSLKKALRKPYYTIPKKIRELQRFSQGSNSL